jgi:hypothetical protein
MDVSRYAPGQKVRCGTCKTIVTVPPPEPAATSSPAPPPKTPPA